MRGWKHSRALLAGATATLAAGLVLPGTVAVADPTDGPGQGGEHANPNGLEHTGPDYNNGKPRPLVERLNERPKEQIQGPNKTGDTVPWLALDDTQGIYFKNYTLRGVGDNIEVWVADDRAFPEGDCRNALGLTDITDEQVQSFIAEFDTNIYPKESAAFSVPPNRNGKQAVADDLVPSIPASAYRGDGDNIVVLVDNVRDANYYDPSSPDGQTYIAGFFYSVFNEYHDRNIMTIDAYDWLHRTGANPPDDSQDPEYLACEAAAGEPRPLLYEGVFAHEYQHLLEYYEDPDELNWVNEGLADWAQTLVGYVDPSLPPTHPDADSHIGCFLGFADPEFGGSEQSLTRWNDQGGPETLCDYGAAYTMMQYLFDHYGGQDLMTALHRDDANGLDGLESSLGSGADVMQIVRDWAAAMSLDQVVGGGATLTGGDVATYTSETLSAIINWANPETHTEDYEGSTIVADGYTEGAPTNGSDYVRLRGADGQPLSAGEIESISFDGAETFPTQPVEWSVDPTPPSGETAATACGNADAAGTVADPALYSGCGVDFDRSIARSVTVPADDPTLTFNTLFDIEAEWDYGFVQVSTDGGKSWTSLANDLTSTATASGAVPAVQENVPGFTGSSGGWVSTSFDLSEYAGQDILLGFRYVTDPAVNEAGFYVDDVAVGGTVVSDGSTLDGWQTYTQINPTAVEKWTVQLVAYDDAGTAAWVAQMPAGGTLSGAELDAAIGESAQTVAALVMAEDRSETVEQYATYSLTVDGVVQPGGGS